MSLVWITIIVFDMQISTRVESSSLKVSFKLIIFGVDDSFFAIIDHYDNEMEFIFNQAIDASTTDSFCN